jgi:hypothetical protein
MPWTQIYRCLLPSVLKHGRKATNSPLWSHETSRAWPTCSVSEQAQCPKQCPLGQPWHRGCGCGAPKLPACCRSSSTSSETFTRFPCAMGSRLPRVRTKPENNPAPWTLSKRKHVNIIVIFELVSPRSALGSASYVDSSAFVLLPLQDGHLSVPQTLREPRHKRDISPNANIWHESSPVQRQARDLFPRYEPSRRPEMLSPLNNT